MFAMIVLRPDQRLGVTRLEGRHFLGVSTSVRVVAAAINSSEGCDSAVGVNSLISAEKLTKPTKQPANGSGAGDGNRTRISSLGS